MLDIRREDLVKAKIEQEPRALAWLAAFAVAVLCAYWIWQAIPPRAFAHVSEVRVTEESGADFRIDALAIKNCGFVSSAWHRKVPGDGYEFSRDVKVIGEMPENRPAMAWVRGPWNHVARPGLYMLTVNYDCKGHDGRQDTVVQMGPFDLRPHKLAELATK